MKKLNEYIKESILDDEDEVMDRIGTSIIDQFLKDNYNLRNCTYTIDNDIVNVDGLIQVKHKKIKELTKLTNGLFKFGEVGVFYCSDCENLISLEGSPKKVKGMFDCSNTGIKDLIGAPEEVGDQFICEDCESLTSLKGSPKKVGGYNCSGSNIKDLTGITQQIKDTLDCSFCERLESLKGSPKKISGCLFIHGCPNLVSLKYCPQEIGGYMKYPKSIKDEDIKDEINRYNIKVKKVVSESGMITKKIN